MKRFLTILTAFISISYGYACSCMNPGEITEEKYNQYDFIGSGEITKVETGELQTNFWIKLEKVYKGLNTNSEIMVRTASSSAACGLHVNKGDTWLLYAYADADGFNSNLCTRSAPLKSEGQNGISKRTQADLVFLEQKASTLKQPATEPYVIGVKQFLYSEILGQQRQLNIYLPEGYMENDTSRYSVVYLLDGSRSEDFLHVVGLLQFANYPWLNYMPPCIVVGIENIDRKHDFTFPSTDETYKEKYPTTGGSADFIKFIELELQPFIAEHFKTSGERMLIGQSLGGLLAAEILYKKPQMFEHYFIVSPSMWYNDFSLFDVEPAFTSADFNKEISVYVAVGAEGRFMKRGAKKLYKSAKTSENIEAQFRYFKDEDHASILHEALYRGFRDFNK